MKCKKYLLHILVIMMLIMAVPTETASAYSANEKKAVTTVKNFLTRIKKYDIKGAGKYQSGKLGYYYWTKKSNYYTVTKSKMKKYFSYKITNVVTNGNRIVVTANVTLPSVYQAMYAAMEDLFYYGCDHPNTSQSKAQKY